MIETGFIYDSADEPPNGILTIAKQFANGANPAEPYGIGYFIAYGVADDPTTKTYLVNGTAGGPVATYPAGIYRFAETTDGHGFVTPNDALPVFKPALISIISGPACSGQLALGYLRNIYEACGSAIDVYEHDASGNVPPLRILSGPATKLDQAYGIYEGK